MSEQRHKAVGGYIFAGGFTLGMQAAGFDVLAHLEDGGYGVKTCRLNFPDLPIFVGADTWPLDSLRDEAPAVVYGNPPCAAWSSLNGKRTTTETWKHDDRINCTLKHFKLLEELEPKAWCWESVERAWSVGREFVEDLVDRAVDLGYSVDLVLFDGQFVGGRHRRRRFFFVATKVDIDWVGPGLTKPLTVQEVLDLVDDPGYGVPLREDLHAAWHETRFNQNLAEAWEELYPPEQREYRETKSGKRFVKGRPSFRYRKMDPNDVAPTVVGDSLVHPHEPRLVTFREAKAFCGYLLDFELESQATGAYDLLTRAVMPPVGEWFGRRVHEALDKNLSAGHVQADGEIKPRVRLVDLRKPDDLHVEVLERQEDWVGDGAPRWLGPGRPKARKAATGGRRRAERGERASRRRTVPVEEVRLPEGVPGPQDLGLSRSGEYIQALLLGNLDHRWRLADEQIARLVLDQFENRRTTISDVAYQRAQLRKRGTEVGRVWYHETEEGKAHE